MILKIFPLRSTLYALLLAWATMLSPACTDEGDNQVLNGIVPLYVENGCREGQPIDTVWTEWQFKFLNDSTVWASKTTGSQSVLSKRINLDSLARFYLLNNWQIKDSALDSIHRYVFKQTMLLHPGNLAYCDSLGWAVAFLPQNLLAHLYGFQGISGDTTFSFWETIFGKKFRFTKVQGLGREARILYTRTFGDDCQYELPLSPDADECAFLLESSTRRDTLTLRYQRDVQYAGDTRFTMQIKNIELVRSTIDSISFDGSRIVVH